MKDHFSSFSLFYIHSGSGIHAALKEKDLRRVKTNEKSVHIVVLSWFFLLHRTSLKRRDAYGIIVSYKSTPIITQAKIWCLRSVSGKKSILHKRKYN